MQHFSQKTIPLLAFTLLVGIGGYALMERSHVRALQTNYSSKENAFQTQLKALERQVMALEQTLTKISGDNKQVALSLQEVKNRAVVQTKSQDDVLTEAVAKVGNSVVSIVITKDIPKLEVVYQNPFGDDPYFRDFGFRIPVYRQKGTEKKKVGAGTGFIINRDGYIITNKHVVADTGAEYTVLLSDGTQKTATVMYRDATHDIALVKIASGNLTPISFGNSSNLKLGQTVIAIGNALGEYNNSVSVGIISGLNRTIQASNSNGTGSETLSGVLQTDAAINPGNSGGPLIDTSGKVVGINVATVINSNDISFAIPADTVKAILAKTRISNS